MEDWHLFSSETSIKNGLLVKSLDLQMWEFKFKLEFIWNLHKSWQNQASKEVIGKPYLAYNILSNPPNTTWQKQNYYPADAKRAGRERVI